MSVIWVIAIVLAVVNLAVFALYGRDKALAKKGARRVPERTLLGAAACFGALGAYLAMRVFRHKTLHKPFAVGVPVMLALQAAALFCLWYFALRG